jgi:lysophospholipid acyltransferase
MYNLPNKQTKNLFSFITGFFLVQWIFGPDWIHTFASSLLTYVLCIVCPKRAMPGIVFNVVMGYMVLAHIYKMYTSYMTGEFDFTGTQMVLTMKLTSFAYNLYDGTTDRERVFDPESKDRVVLSKRKFAIQKLPSLLDFLGYIYCFTCILAGPAFEYQDYIASIDDSAFFVPNENKDDSKKPIIKRPNTLFPAIQRLIVGVIAMIAYLQIGGRFKLSTLHDKTFIANHPYHERWGYLMLSMFGERMKYYFAWKVAEGASLLAGFGFEGYKSNGEMIGFKGVENMDILGFEFANCISMATRVWNKRTQGWLERYTYFRTNNSLLLTYLVSSLWHGLYPGFFFVFLSMPLVSRVERLIREKVNPLIIPTYNPRDPKSYPTTIPARIYSIICWIGSILTMNYVAQTFSMSSFENSWTALSSLYFTGHVVFGSLFLLLSIMPGAKKSKDKSGEKEDTNVKSKSS